MITDKSFQRFAGGLENLVSLENLKLEFCE